MKNFASIPTRVPPLRMKLINLLIGEFNNCSLGGDFRVSRQAEKCKGPVNPILHGVFWITHTWGGQILKNLKDMDLKFGMLK